MAQIEGNDKGKHIILIEDDPDDVDIIRMTLETLGVEAPLHIFKSADEAFDYLQGMEQAPGLILCDMNLSCESGVDLRRQLSENERLREMTIPFVFLTGAVDEQLIRRVYKLPVQGVFLKETSLDECVAQMKVLLEYWGRAITPHASNTTQRWL